jgi:uncharacterized damage-inducible protein DinB
MSMNPYEMDLGGRDALEALADTPERLKGIVERMRGDDFARSYGPDKWSAAQLFGHLAQVEMVYGTRLRMALSAGDYVVQPFDQDGWMANEPAGEPIEAFRAYYALRRWNLRLFRSLTREQLARTFAHPERGTMKVSEILDLLAGHELRHAAKIQEIAKAAGGKVGHEVRT